jgi:hypothetical protein
MARIDHVRSAATAPRFSGFTIAHIREIRTRRRLAGPFRCILNAACTGAICLGYR